MAVISFPSIPEALSQPTSPFFWLSHNRGHFETGDVEGLAAAHVRSGEKEHAFRTGAFLGRTTVLVSEFLKAGELKTVTVRCTSV